MGITNEIIKAELFIVENTGIPCFIVLCKYCIFGRLKISGNPALSKSTGSIFPTTSTHFVCLYHMLVILTIFQFFLLLLYFKIKI